MVIVAHPGDEAFGFGGAIATAAAEGAYVVVVCVTRGWFDSRLTDSSAVQGSYTYLKAEDNSSYSCCTAFAGFEGPRVGAQGPNVIGGIGATEGAWGPSDFAQAKVGRISLGTWPS